MELLLLQLKKAEIEVIWGAFEGKFSWEKRLRYYKQELEKLDKDELVVLTDAWDVLFQGTREELEDLIPTDYTLFSAEMTCPPH